MRINDLLNEEDKSWFGKTIDYIMHGSNNDELVSWVKDNLYKRGSQWIYRNVDKQFPKRYVRSDVDDAIKVVKKNRKRAAT